MKTSTLVASAFMAAIAIPMAANAQEAPKPSYKAEKCYGVAKAGGNDCQTASSSCAGTSKRDNQPDAWIYLPEGSCAKLVGGVAKQRKA